MKTYLLALLSFISFTLSAQRIDSMYVNLYTDSLKKGTFNYINVDGLMGDGTYRPLDSTHLVFTSDKGIFSGNSLYIDPNPNFEKVHIKIWLRDNKANFREFDIYIKKKEDNEYLPTNKEILKKSTSSKPAKNKKKNKNN